MTFSMKKNIIEYDYKVNGSIIQRVTENKDLGIILDAKLSFKKHNE